MSLLFIIPAMILFICVLIYLVIGGTFGRYFDRLEEKSELLQRVLYLIMTKDILSFFNSPDSNRIVDLLFGEGVESEDIEEKLLDSVRSSGPAIENLYGALKRAYAPSASINKARSASSLLRLGVLIYGVVVSVSETIDLYFEAMVTGSRMLFINGLLFGGTIIFAALIFSMGFYIYREITKVDREMERLREPSEIRGLTQ